ncbi:MAG: hypothetical protein K2X66_14210, partial [Cyanobacteria bacterium]|nr:hypothetical protein [Cyanobacteriota bacterium]
MDHLFNPFDEYQKTLYPQGEAFAMNASGKSSGVSDENQREMQRKILAFQKQFHPERIADEMLVLYQPNLALFITDRRALQDAGEILREFCKISAQLIIDKPYLENPVLNLKVPYHLHMAEDLLYLFAGGLYHTLVRFHHEVDHYGDVETIILETIALDLFHQAENILLTLYPQEPQFQGGKSLQSPELQSFNPASSKDPLKEHLMEWMIQTAENALQYYADIQQTPMDQDGFDLDDELLDLNPPGNQDGTILNDTSFNSPRFFGLSFPGEPPELEVKNPGFQSFQTQPHRYIPISHWVRVLRFIFKNENLPEDEGISPHTVMITPVSFPVNALAHQITNIFYDQLYESMVQHHLSEPQIQEVANTLFEYVVIAGKFVRSNLLEISDETVDVEHDKRSMDFPEVQFTETSPPITLTPALLKSSLLLYSEGLFSIILKCEKLAIQGLQKQQLLKEISYDLYLFAL